MSHTYFFFKFLCGSLLNLLQCCFCFMFFLGQDACRILASQPGFEPATLALEGKVLITGPPGKSPGLLTSYYLALYHLPSHCEGVYWQMETTVRRGGDFFSDDGSGP